MEAKDKIRNLEMYVKDIVESKYELSKKLK
jgi:hypothetical protein